jgi:hypothetical protein
MTRITARRVITPLKFVKKFLAYITRHNELYVPYFVPVIISTVFFFFVTAFTCLFYSVLISQLAIKHLFLEVRLITWIVLSHLLDVLESIHKNKYVLRKDICFKLYPSSHCRTKAIRCSSDQSKARYWHHSGFPLVNKGQKQHYCKLFMNFFQHHK